MKKYLGMLFGIGILLALTGCMVFQLPIQEKEVMLDKASGINSYKKTAEKDTGNIEETENIKSAENRKDTEILVDTEASDIQENAIAFTKRIICWGDSLTFGQGGEGVTYPLVLEEKTGLEVLNYGIQGETVKQIAIRMGVLPMTVGAFEIPADVSAVKVTLWQNGVDPIMMRLGDCAINPCRIAGVEGTLSYRAEDSNYYFTRTKEGEAQKIEEGTAVETFASQNKDSSDIIVLFAGTNLPPSKETVDELIDLEKQMLAYLGSEKYVVIGLTSKKLVPDILEINTALEEAFGEHFLDIREYFLTKGLSDAGIEPSKKDKKNLKNGEIPASLRVDEVHGTDVFYRLLGEQVYQKILELGYIE